MWRSCARQGSAGLVTSCHSSGRVVNRRHGWLPIGPFVALWAIHYATSNRTVSTRVVVVYCDRRGPARLHPSQTPLRLLPGLPTTSAATAGATRTTIRRLAYLARRAALVVGGSLVKTVVPDTAFKKLQVLEFGCPVLGSQVKPSVVGASP